MKTDTNMNTNKFTSSASAFAHASPSPFTSTTTSSSLIHRYGIITSAYVNKPTEFRHALPDTKKNVRLCAREKLNLNHDAYDDNMTRLNYARNTLKPQTNREISQCAARAEQGAATTEERSIHVEECCVRFMESEAEVSRLEHELMKAKDRHNEAERMLKSANVELDRSKIEQIEFNKRLDEARNKAASVDAEIHRREIIQGDLMKEDGALTTFLQGPFY